MPCFLGVCILALGSIGCATPPAPAGQTAANELATTQWAASSHPGDWRGLPLFRHQASRLLARSGTEFPPLARSFVQQLENLPPVSDRTLYRDVTTGKFYRPNQLSVLDETVRARLEAVTVNEHRYYASESPLTYIGPLLQMSALGAENLKGRKILDYGYGAIGHLQMLTSMGAEMHGLEISAMREALYTAEDRVVPAGRVSLHHGYFPSDAKVVTALGQDFDWVVARNVLKRRLLEPQGTDGAEVELGVSHRAFAAAMFRLLSSGGHVLIYNSEYLKAPANTEEADVTRGVQCAIARQGWLDAGFEIVEFDRNDDGPARELARALLWNKPSQGKPGLDLKRLVARVTLLRRPTPTEGAGTNDRTAAVHRDDTRESGKL